MSYFSVCRCLFVCLYMYYMYDQNSWIFWPRAICLKSWWGTRRNHGNVLQRSIKGGLWGRSPPRPPGHQRNLWISVVCQAQQKETNFSPLDHFFNQPLMFLDWFKTHKLTGWVDFYRKNLVSNFYAKLGSQAIVCSRRDCNVNFHLCLSRYFT